MYAGSGFMGEKESAERKDEVIEKMDRYEPFGEITEQKAKEKIAQWFPNAANLYAVLDFAVCFGIYNHGCFSLGIEGTAPVALDWTYLRELRVFNEEQELLLVPAGGNWTGRMRRDMGEYEQVQAAGEYVIEECQKLWGRMKQSYKVEETVWSLLVSGRGTRIQIPVDLKGQEEAAIRVRRYMRTPDVERDGALVFQKDIRMAEICPWKGDE